MRWERRERRWEGSNGTDRDVVESFALPKPTLITALKPSDRRSSQSGLKWR